MAHMFTVNQDDIRRKENAHMFNQDDIRRKEAGVLVVLHLELWCLMIRNEGRWSKRQIVQL